LPPTPSTTAITELAKASSRRANSSIGIHFFNAGREMALVEIIQGADYRRRGGLPLARLCGAKDPQTPIVVNDGRFLLCNRCIIPNANEGGGRSRGVSNRQLVNHGGTAVGLFPVGRCSLTDETLSIWGPRLLARPSR